MTEAAQRKIEELLARAVTGTPEELQAMVAEINKELARADFDQAREWHAQMLHPKPMTIWSGGLQMIHGRLRRECDRLFMLL